MGNNLQDQLDMFMKSDDLPTDETNEEIKNDEINQEVQTEEENSQFDDTSTDGEFSTDVLDDNDGDSDSNRDMDTDAGDPPSNEESIIEPTQISNDLVEQNRQLMAIVKSLTEGKEKQETVVPEVSVELEDEEVFKAIAEELDLDEIGAKKLSTFFKYFEQRTTLQAVNQALKMTPNVINQLSKQEAIYTETRKKFYDDNPELNAVKPYVVQLANQISAEDNTLSLEQVLEKVSTQAYKSLGITKKIKIANNGNTGERKKPAFANTSGSRKQPVKKSKQDNEIEAMLSLDY